MQIRGSRQETTGLIVNEKVNIRQEYYRTVRSMCNALFQTGQYYVETTVGEDGSEAPSWTTELAPLEGRLAHVYYVKTRRDRSQRINRLANFVPPNAPLDLYRRFLFYKYFVASTFPVIVTEGKTDIIYLRTAMKALRANYPTFFESDAEDAPLWVRYLNPTTVNQKLLNLGSGFSGMAQAVIRYEKSLLEYNHKPLTHPVIFVVDNDNGGEKVLKEANKVSSSDIQPTSADAFYHICNNLYLVKTPPKGEGEWSDIEDCFPEAVLSQEVGGKYFDRKKRRLCTLQTQRLVIR